MPAAFKDEIPFVKPAPIDVEAAAATAKKGKNKWIKQSQADQKSIWNDIFSVHVEFSTINMLSRKTTHSQH